MNKDKQIVELREELEKCSVELGLLQAKCNILVNYDTKTGKFGKKEQTIFEKVEIYESIINSMRANKEFEDDRIFYKGMSLANWEKKVKDLGAEIAQLNRQRAMEQGAWEQMDAYKESNTILLIKLKKLGIDLIKLLRK